MKSSENSKNTKKTRIFGDDFGRPKGARKISTTAKTKIKALPCSSTRCRIIIGLRAAARRGASVGGAQPAPGTRVHTKSACCREYNYVCAMTGSL